MRFRPGYELHIEIERARLSSDWTSRGRATGGSADVDGQITSQAPRGSNSSTAAPSQSGASGSAGGTSGTLFGRDHARSRLSVRPPNASVRLAIMVPKGADDAVVPTDCSTDVVRKSFEPQWHVAFRLPVMPHSDVLLLQLFFHKDSHVRKAISKAANNIAAPAAPAAPEEGDASNTGAPQPAADEEAAAGPSGNNQTRANDSVYVSEGDCVGACLLPIAHLSQSGEVSACIMDIISTAKRGKGSHPSPQPQQQPEQEYDGDKSQGQPGPSSDHSMQTEVRGRLWLSAKIERTQVALLERADLDDGRLLGRLSAGRLLEARSRFLGVGEVAAFLYLEGHSEDMDENWEAAVTMLAQQLAFRLHHVLMADTKYGEASTALALEDSTNFRRAREQVERDGGLWDGV